jgi:hypothetical protein
MKLFYIGMLIMTVSAPVIIAIAWITQHLNQKYDPSEYYKYCNLLERGDSRASGSLSVDQVFERKSKAAQKRERILVTIIMLFVFASAVAVAIYLVKDTVVGDWIYSLMSHGIISLLLVLAGLILLLFLSFLVSLLIYILIYCGIILVKNKARGGIRRFASAIRIKKYKGKKTR